MDTMSCLSQETPRKKMTTKTMRMRPVLEHRMPTLASKAAFVLRGQGRTAGGAGGGELSALTAQPPGGLLRLQQAVPPRTMRDVRTAVTKEMKSVTRKLARLEREYFGEQRTVHQEAEKYVYPVKMLMKAQWILDLNRASFVEDMIKVTNNPERFKGDPKHAALLKEVFAKVQAFLPEKIAPLVESCQGLLNNLDRYCVSFYDAECDCYLETPAHYTEQMKVWKARAEASIQSVRSLNRKFRTTGITAAMLSGPVASFCSRWDMNKLLFLVMFADACTHIRSALSVMALWLKTDASYAQYVRNDLDELEKLREDKMKALRELRQKYHTLTYTVSKLEADHAKLSQELGNMRNKENGLRINEVSIVNTLSDMELEIEFKEKRRDSLRKRPAESEHNEPCTETLETLTSDLKSLKERLPLVVRSLGQVRLLLSQVDVKLGALERVSKDIHATRTDLGHTEEERDLKEQEHNEVVDAIQLARRILLCKTASDATEKLYYSVPFETKATKAKGEINDPVSRACKIITAHIERDWVSLYRNLRFQPPRGAETVERDIIELQESCGRASLALTSRHALERWKRFHTRANVEDLRQALRSVKRQDIVKAIDDLLKAPRVTQVPEPVEPVEEVPPPVEEKLVPFYRQIERYDQLRASKRAEAVKT